MAESNDSDSARTRKSIGADVPFPREDWLAELRVSEATFTKWIQAGLITVKLGNRIAAYPSDIKHFLRQHCRYLPGG